MSSKSEPGPEAQASRSAVSAPEFDPRALTQRQQHVLEELRAGRETVWLPESGEVTASGQELDPALVDAAEERFRWFAPFLADQYPESRHLGGILESRLVRVPALQAAIAEWTGQELGGALWVKCDHELPVSGSVKSRGGIHEVLEVAQQVAAEHELDLSAGAMAFRRDDVRSALREHTIVVGSTGNLGLSIGLMSAALGFSVTVHMSMDAKSWKKDKLRSAGADVVEHSTDFTTAVEQGRLEAQSDPQAYFVDDERSVSLLMGYAVAARRLAGQLQAASVTVDEDRPLCLYLPCGIGGAPGGITFGLKQIFGDAVHCFLAEPTQMPAVTLGRLTGLDDRISVQDIGLDGPTAADGLAVGRPSGLVGATVGDLIGGFATATDDNLLRTLALAHRTEDLRLEPSACAGLYATTLIRDAVARDGGGRTGLTPERLHSATHIAWLTGGTMVPDSEIADLLAQGDDLLAQR